MYETRKQLLKKIRDLCYDLNECELELENVKPGISYAKMTSMFADINRRLDRLEETACSIISHIKEPISWLKSVSEEIYEEQASAKGDQDE